MVSRLGTAFQPRLATVHVLTYELNEQAWELSAPEPEEHHGRHHQFRARGTLLAAGDFADHRGAMAIFSSREAAEAFATGDPLIARQVASNWAIREWIVGALPNI